MRSRLAKESAATKVERKPSKRTAHGKRSNSRGKRRDDDGRTQSGDQPLHVARHRTPNWTVVRQGPARWQANSGQYLLYFDVAPAHGEVAFLDKRQRAEEAHRWLDQAIALEFNDPAAPAYRRAIDADPQFLAAHLNLGCLLHAGRKTAAAEQVFRETLARWPGEPLLHFNLGTALEDLHRTPEAIDAYRHALAFDFEFADAHYNVARLYEAAGRHLDTVRHLSSYWRLQR